MIDKINKELDKLKMSKKYRKRIVNLEAFFTHDFTMQLSIRKDAGKTTQALILGLILYKIKNGECTTEYVRCDKGQITRGNIETLYDVIISNKYIEKLYPGEYNTVIYKQMQRKFYLAYESITDDGNVNIERVSNIPLCHVSCLEDWQKLKSSYNNPYGDFFLFDEFMDTSRATQRMMIELENNISTITRYRDSAHVLMLGNNTDRYSFWWDEFCITKDIPTLDFGGYIEKITELGTTLYCELLEVSEEQKEIIQKKKIRFSGFDTPKMAAFNGLEPWQGSSHPHIPDLDMLDKNKLIYNNIWIRHRNRYVRLNIYYDSEFGYYLFIHFSNEPRFEDGIVLTTEPSHFNETYGFGKACLNQTVISQLNKVVKLIHDRRVYYCSNLVGDLVLDYRKEVAQ